MLNYSSSVLFLQRQNQLSIPQRRNVVVRPTQEIDFEEMKEEQVTVGNKMGKQVYSTSPSVVNENGSIPTTSQGASKKTNF